MQMLHISTSTEKLVFPYANALVSAMMRSYPLKALVAGDLLVPLGRYRQIIGDNYLLDGNLHEFLDEPFWHDAKAIFRLEIATSGTALERTTILNCWFDYGIFDRELSNFRANKLDEPMLRRLAERHPDIRWDFADDGGCLRF
jgi:hypothetical protein